MKNSQSLGGTLHIVESFVSYSITHRCVWRLVLISKKTSNLNFFLIFETNITIIEKEKLFFVSS